MRPLPISPDQVTEEWLTDVLRNASILRSSEKIIGIKRAPIGERGGMVSEIEFLSLTYSEHTQEAPRSLVVKFPTTNETNRQMAEDFGVYEREIRSYLEIVPQSLSASPKVYLADIEGKSNFVIILEDLSDYRLGDQVIGATLEETGLGIDELAKLHGSFWGKVEAGYDWLPRFSNSQNAHSMVEGAKASWDPTVEKFGEYLPEKFLDAKERYLAALPALQKRLDGDPVTVIHGDFRLDNLFFGQTPDQLPIVFVDWGVPLRGSGIVDVAYFMSQSTQTEVRRSHEKDLITRYVEGVKAQGISEYSVDVAWEDYRYGVLYLWAFASMVAGSMDAGNQRSAAWITEMVKRNIAAIEDLSCLELL
tara:strand:- start:694 stop:1782 length:1089 start_codon:yes stop_codon:yes gene_type:complete